jgi:hypothetical protein
MFKFDAKKKAKIFSHDLKETLRTPGEQKAGGGIAGEIKPGGSIDFSSFARESAELEKRYWERFYLQAERIRQEEKSLHEGKEQQLTYQIHALQAELNEIAKATEDLESEVKVAAFQAPVEPGIYHVSFFENLKLFIKTFRAKIENSAAWLAAFNARSKKRNFYWGQVKKSGTSFMLSGERSLATQAG